MTTAGRDKLLNDVGVFVVICAFKLRPQWEPVRAPAGEIGEEIENLVAQSRDRLCAEMYLSQGLKASCDYFLRVHAYDLEDAQLFLSRYRKTALGRHSELSETLVGLTKERQYITADKTPKLNKDLAAESYQGSSPRFAVVIPVKKSAEWWNMPEERRREEISIHTERTLPYLSKVKRKLYHSAGLDDLDFITYFETDDLKAFHELVVALARLNENRFHTRYGNPLLLGSIHGIVKTVCLLLG